MNWQAFQESLHQPSPPTGVSLHLQALWQDANNNWKAAHDLIQDEPDAFSARIHAYLHRKEGDPANAAYWYRRAGCSIEKGSLEKEWEALARACCTRQ